MNMQYGAISKFYGLLDILFFNRKETSPRYGILDFISDEKLKVLEVCIGTAENSIIIAEKRPNTEIIGVDLSKEMLGIAKDNIEKRKIRNIKTLVMDATNMNFDDNYFDVVLISLVLHEVDDNVRYKIMKEAKRVLKIKGKIIIVEWDKPKKIIQKLMFFIIELSEPSWFKEFLKLDIKEYVKKFTLKVLSEKKYDYTRIIEITKERI
jgi:demethylmenaquinone methyltransferase/2-methoxy-6-polyprenyl-1,4-benzoquinol methylase